MRLWSLVGLSLVAALTSCGPAPEETPPDAVIVPATAEGLRALFVEECIGQKHGDWVREQYERRMAEACWLDRSDTSCIRYASGQSWTIPISNGARVLLSMSWTAVPGADPVEAPPAGKKLTCKLSVPTALSDELYNAAKSLTASDAFWGVERADPEWQGSALWGPQDRTIIVPQISFYPSSANSPDAYWQAVLTYQVDTIFPVYADE